MTERKFTRGLTKKGYSAQLREKISQVVRESVVLNKTHTVEPIDFETFIMKNKMLIQNDPQRELLIYPTDDITEVIQPKKYRTVSINIPSSTSVLTSSSISSLSSSSVTTTTSVTSTTSSKKQQQQQQQQQQQRESISSNNSSCSSNLSLSSSTGLQQQQQQQPGLLLTRQALHSYESNNHLIEYKYSAYSGTCHDLPRNNQTDEKLKEEVYEIDADPDRIDEQMTKSQADTITKQGYLLKGPETSSDRVFAHIGSKSFKRRYCYLRQEVDGTYILEIHKDEKQGEAKATIVMDFCTDVVQNPKRGRFCFELRMTAGHKSFTLAADNETEMQDWLTKLSSVLQQNKLQDDKRVASLERGKGPPSSPCTMIFGTLKGLDQSMNPQLIKYGRETDISIAQTRRENRRKVFGFYQNSNKATVSENIEPYREQFGQRIFLKCESLKFKLQVPNEQMEKESLCQLEPYITSLALYDAKAGRKLTENFYFDLNSAQVKDMLQQQTDSCIKIKQENGTTNGKTTTPSSSSSHTQEWLMYPRQAILSVTASHPDIFLVVKIDKILQGSINQSTEPYLKGNKDIKLAVKLNKTMKMLSNKIGHYRMPFAWAARPLFRLYSSDLDTAVEFPAIYRQEGNKLKDDELLKLLSEYRKPDKFSKLTVIPGSLKISIDTLMELPKNCLTTTLAPLKPFTVPPDSEPSIEITEFAGISDRDYYPYTTFQNHLFVYPLSLSFDSQKLFSRARNIAVLIELRDNDCDGAKALKCIYGRAGQNMFVQQISCPVLHHNTTPTFYEEIKINLPLNITTKHHILFSFLHVSCDITKKKDNTMQPETPVGYAWLPLLNKGKMNIDEQQISVAATLPAGYLSIQPLGLGKGQNAGPEIQWIDNQRQLFTVTFRLDSTVLTTDQHLHNLFCHAERLLEQTKPSALLPAESETCKILKAAHAIHVTSVITFMPTIMNQLFILLVNTTSEEVGLNIIRLLVNLIHMIADEAGRKELLVSYIKYVFKSSNFQHKLHTASPKDVQRKTVHGELCQHLPTLLHPNNTDFLIVNKFMKYSSIFFDLIIKSMAQHLLTTERIKMLRHERFPKEFSSRVESLFQVLIPYIISRHKDLPIETQHLNKSLSIFVKRLLSFMDRGFVFKLIRMYMDCFSPGDPRQLQEFKFTFLQEICSHEHYVPLNLPFLLSPKNRAPDVLQHFTLSEEFCRQHFLAGLVLQEVKSSLNEIGNIRRLALQALKELLAKHDLDDRYQKKGQLSRIAILYVPWLGIVMENIKRISDGSGNSANGSQDKRLNDTLSMNSSINHRYSCNSSFIYVRDNSSCSNNNTINSNQSSSLSSTPKSTLKNRLTLHIEHPSPFRMSMNLKDNNYLAAIAGQSISATTTTIGSGNGTNGHSTNSLDSDCSTLSQETTVILRNGDDSTDSFRIGNVGSNLNGSNGHGNGHTRSISMTQTNALPRCDKFSINETKDMLICFLFVIKHLSDEQILMWWQNCTENEMCNFFTILDMCLIYFRYIGKKNLIINDELNNKDINKVQQQRVAKASTLPARMVPPTVDTINGNVHETGTLTHVQNRENLLQYDDETIRQRQILIETNMATEIGLIVLDCMGLYSIQFRDKMLDGLVLPRIARVYLRFLQLGQSETLSKHVFAALRAFINNFSSVLFKGNAILCGQLVFELLKCCDSRLACLRQESCAVLYLLMRSNFEFSGRKGLTRVHLQVIISVSQMIGNVIGLNNARFQESLSLINSYASSDKAMKGTGFPIEVKDLTRRVRTVLMATAQMQAHHMDPERLLELQYSLANSYASTPELRHTWLVTMARNHELNGNISEAACCNLHIAALMAEYLKLKGGGYLKWGAELFTKISKNIPRDERGLKLDSGGQDSQYTEQMLLDQLKECADYLDRSERYECLGELYRMIIPILEFKRDFHGLARSYEHLSESYNKVIEVSKTGRRLLGRFYRITFFGQLYFEEDNGIEFVYKEPKVTSLSEISERILKQYTDKFGSDVVKIIMDSSPVDVNSLDPKLAYIQVTHVIPYFCKDELEARQTEFEQNHDVDIFMYETPFTKSGSARGLVEEQWKRRTILTTQYSFPYVLKRIPVKDRHSIELNPIEVAIDEMQTRVSEIEEVVLAPIDVKKLQLRLQGSIAVSVNAGPLAYASAFLDPKLLNKYSIDLVEDLKDIFRQFTKICFTALQINGRVISADQREYHSALRDNYQKLCTALSELLGENLISPEDENTAHRNSLALFSAISGAPSNSSTA